MSARPDTAGFRAFLAGVARRMAWISAAGGAAAGFLVAGCLVLAGWPSHGTGTIAAVTGAMIAAGIAASLGVSRGRRARVALEVERRAPRCRNLIVTAEELLRADRSRGGRSRVSELIYVQAASLARSLDVPALFPARRRVAILAGAAALWALAATRTATTPPVVAIDARRGGPAVISGIDVTVIPPGYASRPERALRDPARVEALAGSQIRVSIRAEAARVALATLRSADTISAANGGAFTATVTADGDGYIAVEPIGADGRAGVRRLIGLSVIPDEAPRVSISAPGRDVHFDDGRQTLGIAIEAHDDIGLAALRLRYTRVSGSGERFTFTEGEVPIAITRHDERSWNARVSWRLDGLALGPGDMVVYRAIAADHRPGAAPTESDSYIAEVTAPGGVAAAGFAIDPEQERYAVSQQMVILKTERLAAQRATMPGGVYGLAAAEIAAEQRKVRAEFVFMMGGELADAPDPDQDMNMLNEEAEAEGEADLAAGRNLNQGRVAILRAIRSMSRAATSLTTADLATALTHERAALVQLERAFARTRIILRALTQRERLDLSRRLSGELAEAARDARPRPEPDDDAPAGELRRALAGIASLAGSRPVAGDAAFRATVLAESVLRVDPSSRPLQAASADLASAASAITRRRYDEARDLLDRAATAIAAVVGSRMSSAPRAAPALELDRLGGALTDALRGRGGAR